VSRDAKALRSGARSNVVSVTKARKMIVGHHVIFGCYGFWLPNDPRGSWSDFVGAWELFRHGPATKVTERRSLASRPHDRAARVAAKQSLKYPAVELSEAQREAVGKGFATYFERSRIAVWTCAILPDHVHLVVARPKYSVEKMVIQLKGEATQALKEQGIHPLSEWIDEKGKTPKCFARGEWKVFLDPDDVPRAIRYAEGNPEKEGLPPQRWGFVTAYPG
ncbi:MAG: transposase, partial [Planctomycetaceae bacterium]